MFSYNGDSAKRCFGGQSLYKNEEEIARDIRGSVSPEVGLHNLLKIEGIRILELNYDHKLEGYNNTLGQLMGFYHINAGERGWFDK
ncbi:MAG: hypothetical protein HC836_28085 [Richelia sp. RM2_1_2]|nr:hypothetical protein [Richelia sp. RM2_1_2]